MILFYSLSSSAILLILSLLFQNPNGLYVPRIYGHVDPHKCLFISQTGQKHKIFIIDNIFMFGRVYLLDAHNKAELHKYGKCLQNVEILQNPPEICADQIVQNTHQQVMPWKQSFFSFLEKHLKRGRHKL
jgi:hypothetical protein